MSGAAGTDMNSSTTGRPRLVSRPRPSTSGSGRTPTHRIRDRVGTFLPGGGLDVAVEGLGDRLAGAHLGPRRRRTRSAVFDRCDLVRQQARGSRSIHRIRWPARPGSVPASRVLKQLPLGRRLLCPCSRRRDLRAGGPGFGRRQNLRHDRPQMPGVDEMSQRPAAVVMDFATVVVASVVIPGRRG